MIDCVIIDDEQQCVDLLTAMILAKLAHRLSIRAALTDPQQAMELLKSDPPRLVFLDVEMPGINGLQLLKDFPDRPFSVVFTTAHDRYALDALKNEAVDYLLKPISLQELYTAVEKVEKRWSSAEKASPAPPSLKKLTFPSGKGSVVVDPADIFYIESENNYSIVHLAGQPRMVLARTLKSFDEQLSRQGFFRIHQSYLINLSHLKSYQSGEPGFAVLSNGAKLEISRRKRVDFLKLLGKS